MNTYFQIAIGNIPADNLRWMETVKDNADEYKLFKEKRDRGRIHNVTASNILRVEICAEHPDWIYLDNDIEWKAPFEMPEAGKPYFSKCGRYICNSILCDNGSGLITMSEELKERLYKHPHLIRGWLDSYKDRCKFFDNSAYIHH